MEIDYVDTSPHDLEARIARQLPVISAQRDSLAAVLLTRWLSLTARYGLARLEAAHHRGRTTWSLAWHTPTHQAKALAATTLAELFVCLLAEMTLEERKRWAGDMGSHGKTVGTRQPVQRERASSGSNATS
jgi:hypothetical protein